jgi:halimadienyl-diphosphate synthase
MSLFCTGCRCLCSARVCTRQEVRLDRHALALLSAVARDLKHPDGGGANSLSVYESSWVSLVRDPARPSTLLYPETFAWILQRQRPDGGWGPGGPYAILPTMAALQAILAHPHGARAHARAVTSGTRYLQTALAGDALSRIDTPFIELLAPMLAESLQERGLSLPVAELEVVRARGAKRRAGLPLEAIYHPRSTLVHALEVFGTVVDYQRIRDRRTRDGGYGASPAATAAVLLHAPAWDHAAANWLARLARRATGDGKGGMPAAHPLDVFEVAWALHFLQQGGYRLNIKHPIVEMMAAWLRASIGPEGIGMTRSRALPEDGDDTATALAALNNLGITTSLDPLRAFEADGHYLSYHGESSASLSANAHALEALLSAPPGEREALRGRVATTMAYLLERRAPEGYWSDKWHISPYYATQACVHALARTAQPAMRQTLGAALAWIAGTQHSDGGWGCTSSSLEESAYALLTIAAARHAGGPLSSTGGPARQHWVAVVARGRRYLQRHLDAPALPDSLPPLWVDKDLYAPPRIIRAAVLAALRVSAPAGWRELM